MFILSSDFRDVYLKISDSKFNVGQAWKLGAFHVHFEGTNAHFKFTMGQAVPNKIKLPYFGAFQVHSGPILGRNCPFQVYNRVSCPFQVQSALLGHFKFTFARFGRPHANALFWGTIADFKFTIGQAIHFKLNLQVHSRPFLGPDCPF